MRGGKEIDEASVNVRARAVGAGLGTPHIAARGLASLHTQIYVRAIYFPLSLSVSLIAFLSYFL